MSTTSEGPDWSESLENIISQVTQVDKETSISTTKSTDSLICLAEFQVSDTKTKIFNQLYPIPEDPGLVENFWVFYPHPVEYNNDGIEKFINLTRTMKLRPVKRILDALKTDKLSLRYYGLDSRIVRPICEALFNNPFVKALDLTDNWLSVDACFHLDDLLTNNHVLTYLNLSGCRIGPRGAKRLKESIGAAHSLRYLNVSRCDLGNEGFKYISIGVYCSATIEVVDLSHNNLEEAIADDCQTMLMQTDTLQELNLSWNDLCTDNFWNKFVLGLMRNTSLLELDMSWNSLEDKCLPYLQKCLSESQTLLIIKLKYNLFNETAAEIIGKSLAKNKVLQEIYLGNNPLTPTGTFNLVKNLKNIPSDSNLKLIDLEDIWAHKDILPLMGTVKIKSPNLGIKLAGIISNYELNGPDVRKIFFKRANYEISKKAKKRSKRKRDFGQFIMSLDDIIVSEEEFRKKMRTYKLKLRESLIVEIMNAFKIGNDAIDLKLMKESYLKEYPDTKPAPSMEKVKVKKNKKKVIKKIKK